VTGDAGVTETRAVTRLPVHDRLELEVGDLDAVDVVGGQFLDDRVQLFADRVPVRTHPVHPLGRDVRVAYLGPLACDLDRFGVFLEQVLVTEGEHRRHYRDVSPVRRRDEVSQNITAGNLRRGHVRVVEDAPVALLGDDVDDVDAVVDEVFYYLVGVHRRPWIQGDTTEERLFPPSHAVGPSSRHIQR